MSSYLIILRVKIHFSPKLFGIPHQELSENSLFANTTSWTIECIQATKASLSEPGRSVMLAGLSREELRLAGAFRSIRSRSVIRGIDRGALSRREWRLWRRVARELAELSIPVP